MMFSPYFVISLFILMTLALGVCFLGISWLRAPHKPDSEKLSPYECGFDPIEPLQDKAHHPFQIHFSGVAILFIIFDVEIAFLIPWAVSVKEIGLLGFSSMMLFLGILSLGLFYEWKKGVLNWP